MELAYNMRNFLWRMNLLRTVKGWALESLELKLVNTGARIVRHAWRIIFQVDEVAVPKDPFAFYSGTYATTRLRGRTRGSCSPLAGPARREGIVGSGFLGHKTRGEEMAGRSYWCSSFATDGTRVYPRRRRGRSTVIPFPHFDIGNVGCMVKGLQSHTVSDQARPTRSRVSDEHRAVGDSCPG